jgi:hypothetical protein
MCSLPGYYVPKGHEAGMTDLEGRNFASLDGVLSDTPREPASIGRVYSWSIKKGTRPEASHGASPLSERKHRSLQFIAR